MKKLVVTAAWALGLALVLGSGCGSDDGAAAPTGNEAGSAGLSGDASADANGGSGGRGGTSGGGRGGRGGASGSGGSAGSDASCGLSPFGAAPIPANILVVLDRSESMNIPYGLGETRWTAMKKALNAALDAVKTNVDFGLELFPSGLLACSVAPPNVVVKDGPVGVPEIASVLDTNLPTGFTPTAAALGQALSYFRDGAGRDLPGKKYVLLATDGGPNCSFKTCGVNECTPNIDGLCPVLNCCTGSVPIVGRDGCLDDNAVTQVAALRSAGIDTFVVGLEIDKPQYRDMLNRMADAGGRAVSGDNRFYAVSSSAGVAGLTGVLKSITGSLITTCNLQLASRPPDLNLLNVYVDNRPIPQAGADGWDVSQATNPPTIVLKGATCRQVQTSGAQTIRVVYGCPTVKEPVPE